MCCLSMGLWLHVSNVIFVCINTYLIIADCSFIRMRQSYLYNLLYPVHAWRRFAYCYFLSYRRVGECVVVGLRIRMAVYVVNGALYRSVSLSIHAYCDTSLCGDADTRLVGHFFRIIAYWYPARIFCGVNFWILELNF